MSAEGRSSDKLAQGHTKNDGYPLIAPRGKKFSRGYTHKYKRRIKRWLVDV